MDLDSRAREVMQDNDLGNYTVPTKGLYPYQWNWDSAFCALGFNTYSEDRAWLEIETLFASQWQSGFVPHIIFHKQDPNYFPGPDVWQSNTSPECTGITQPPVSASMILALWKSGDKRANKARLQAIFPKLVACHRWFYRTRDPLNKGLVLTVHPWETGRDNSPEWDAAARRIDTSEVGTYQRKDITHVNKDMRPLDEEYDRYITLLKFGRATQWDHDRIAKESPFKVIDVCMTMILSRADHDLMLLAEELGEAAIVEELKTRIALTRNNINYLWDDQLKAFCSKDLISGLPSGHITSASFLAFYADVGSQEQREYLLAHLDRIASKVKYLIPSLDPESDRFDSMRYWRGPVWSVVNYLAALGLKECGQSVWAQRILDDTRALVKESGFYEAFCPLTGAGTGGDHFTWTAAIWLYWLDI
ncbi:MGH1-like glycoside hydrolase domain-containing protein [Agarilytica rhodophyticola]|uniref:MGH1-like glycoside hydrolase domain-containing protein n=1 Tax=Agarilytica rhodophyticola TaxID=1737490 RepID=UPI001C1F9813|nr:trehalase family glycosidase [Agarilytica rhodophyticola]